MLSTGPLLRSFPRRPAFQQLQQLRRCSTPAYTSILTEKRPEGVALITLNRPKALNALTPTLVKELADAAAGYDADPDVGAIVITGSGDKAFVAGADIKFMAEQSYMDMRVARPLLLRHASCTFRLIAPRAPRRYKGLMFSELENLSKVRKPIIAAVNGFALGGGCELAMLCDFILAADSAKFGQPEIKLGTIPGLGGTQRFPRAIGKVRARARDATWMCGRGERRTTGHGWEGEEGGATRTEPLLGPYGRQARAMELTLTGDLMTAEEACTRGLVRRQAAKDGSLGLAPARGPC